MKMYIGENIKNQRLKANMTQEELAERLGVSNKLVWSWEKNRTEPKAEAVQKMIKVFDCSIEELTKQINIDVSYDEYLLIEQYRTAPNSQKTRLKAYFDFMSDQLKKGSDSI